jgi:hypothetical protein
MQVRPVSSGIFPFFTVVSLCPDEENRDVYCPLFLLISIFMNIWSSFTSRLIKTLIVLEHILSVYSSYIKWCNKQGSHSLKKIIGIPPNMATVLNADKYKGNAVISDNCLHSLLHFRISR